MTTTHLLSAQNVDTLSQLLRLQNSLNASSLAGQQHLEAEALHHSKCPLMFWETHCECSGRKKKKKSNSQFKQITDFSSHLTLGRRNAPSMLQKEGASSKAQNQFPPLLQIPEMDDDIQKHCALLPKHQQFFATGSHLTNTKSQVKSKQRNTQLPLAQQRQVQKSCSPMTLRTRFKELQFM